MLDWTIALPTFLAASVEWVEAFTIVLAVSLSIGWAAASGAAAAALGVLALMTIVTGGVLQLGAAVSWLQLVIGIFLLLFGVRWLAKAVARRAGLKALHDEEAGVRGDPRRARQGRPACRLDHRLQRRAPRGPRGLADRRGAERAPRRLAEQRRRGAGGARRRHGGRARHQGTPQARARERGRSSSSAP